MKRRNMLWPVILFSPFQNSRHEDGVRIVSPGLKYASRFFMPQETLSECCLGEEISADQLPVQPIAVITPSCPDGPMMSKKGKATFEERPPTGSIW